VSSNAGTPWDELGGSVPWWLQAYLPTDREQMCPVLERAVEAGAAAVVLTADTPFPGSKYAADAEDWSGVDLGWWRANFPPPHPDRWAADLRFDDVRWLREAAGIPVVVKGVLRGDDAVRCLDAGAEAIYVSNHGGRQLDRAATPLEVLPDVVAAVAGRAEVYVDGGVLSGADVAAAVGLGARAALVGRAYLYGLMAGGEAGVDRALEILRRELLTTMQLIGVTSVGELAKDRVRLRS
jgi:4-hydroxymandelate oxidase